MLVFLLLGSVPVPLLLALLLALYLAVVELRGLSLNWKWWVWWLQLVLLTHFLGYLALRGYAVYRRRHLASA